MSFSTGVLLVAYLILVSFVLLFFLQMPNVSKVPPVILIAGVRPVQ